MLWGELSQFQTWFGHIAAAGMLYPVVAIEELLPFQFSFSKKSNINQTLLASSLYQMSNHAEKILSATCL